jgi:hypothetical protein
MASIELKHKTLDEWWIGELRNEYEDYYHLVYAEQTVESVNAIFLPAIVPEILLPKSDYSVARKEV